MGLIPVLSVCGHVVRWQVREYRFRRAVKGLSEVLKPGMNRGDVERYVRSRNLRFLRSSGDGDAWSDFAVIRKEKPGWLCEEQNLYAAFDFTATEPQHDWNEAHDSDRLLRVYPIRSACWTWP